MVAEQRSDDKPQGLHAGRFKELMAASIDLDLDTGGDQTKAVTPAEE